MAKATPRFLGARIRRREDPALLTGRARYVADLPLEGVATLAFVRSPYAHARLGRIDAASARAMPGVLGVWTAAELHRELAGPLPVVTEPDGGEFRELACPPRYPLATDRVRHVGDPVAVVAAESPYVAADAVAAVAVDYEPLEAVVDVEAALDPAAPRLYDELEGNRAYRWVLEGGDVDAAFAAAAVVVELPVRIQRLVPTAMEPRAVAAAYDAASERFTVWASTQIPHLLQKDLAEVLGLPRGRIRVVAPEVGGGFGAKSNVYPEDVVAPLLARRLGRPVRWVATRSEDFVSTSHGRDQTDRLRVAADADGRIRAVDLRVLADVGAYYLRGTPTVPPLTGLMMTGVYDIPAARAEVVGVFTNKVPMEPYRGAGRPEAAYLVERGVDLLARRLGLDPAEIRKRNFIAPERFPVRTASGLEYDSGEYGRALATALRRVGYRRLRAEQRRRRRAGGPLLGIGLSCYVEICGFGPWELGTVRVEPDARVVVLTGTSPHGQGHRTAWAQIAAQVLEVPLDRIEVRHGDTDVVPRGIGTFGSRSAPVGGVAVYRSAERVREAAKAIAAHLLEAAAEDIVLSRGRFHVAGFPARAVDWEAIAAAAYGGAVPDELRRGLDAETRHEPPGETYPFGAHVAVVEVDPATGEVRLLRYVSVDDCGPVINPLLVEGQIHGGLAQGIAQALSEEAVFDEAGNLLTGSLLEYALPRAERFPRFETHRTETPTPLNPLGVKGIGEAATIGSTPAVVGAVLDALAPFGVEELDTPLTPEKIWRALRVAASKQGGPRA